MGLPAGVFTLVFLLTLLAWHIKREDNRRQTLAQFGNVVSDIRSHLESDLRILAGVTAAGAAYVNASQDITRREWAVYVDSLRLAERHTGISVLGYVEKVMKTDTEGFAARTRADDSPDFHIHYQGGAASSPFDDLYPVKYSEPHEVGHRALGFDLGSHPTRRRAIERAAASGSFTLSDVIQLEWSVRPESWFLFIFPIYHAGGDLSTEAARRDALKGLISSPFPCRSLLNDMPPELRRRAVFQIINQTDEGTRELLLDAADPGAFAPEAARQPPVERELATGGRVWLIRALPTPVFLAENRRASHRLVLLLGGALSLALGALAHYAALSARRNELRRSVTEGQLELALKSSGVGAWSWDLTARTVHWSEGTGLLYGLSGEAGTRSYDAVLGLIHPADRPRVSLDNLSRSSLKSTFEVSYRVVWPDGSEHILGARGRVLPDGQGHPICMTGVSWDETARQRATDAVQQSETRFRTLFESSHDAVLIANEHRFIDCNRMALKMLGCPSKEHLLTLQAADISPLRQPCGSNSAHLAAERIQEAIRQGSCRFEWTHRRLDSGTSFPSEVILSRMDTGGELLLQGTVRDMSTRVQMQQRIAAHEQALQRLSAALFSAEHRERRSVAAGLHDEVCQSLVLARLKLKAVKQAGDTETARGIAEELDTLIKRLLGTCHTMIFDLATPVLDKLGLQAALEELCERIQREHGLVCSLECRGDPGGLTVETSQFLYHSVRELLLNVQKHARAGRARVVLRTGGRRVMAAVEDDGIGCHPAAIEGFSPTGGFGLFSLRERIQNLGGRIHMKPRTPHGTLFVLRISIRGARA